MKYKSKPEIVDRAVDMYIIKLRVLTSDEFQNWLIRAFFVLASVASHEVLDFVATHAER